MEGLLAKRDLSRRKVGGELLPKWVQKTRLSFLLR
jgi:hypothetical protein